MKVLVINCGSSSLKYQLFNMDDQSVKAKGLVDRIAIDGSTLTHQPAGKDKVVITTPIANHQVGIELVLKALTDAEHGVIQSFSEIEAVGHRVVHGGEKFSSSVKIDDEVMAVLEECSTLAPLHNPPNITGILACQSLLPGVPQVAVFDTAFHQTMPEHAYIYGLPYELYKKHAFRRYGFHGTSHKYVAARAAAMLGKPIEDTKIITCHLGNGASITAVKGGKSVDTTMGLTPLEGLLMGTRCGDIDPAIVTQIMEKEGLSVADVNNLMNKKSGVLGVSCLSSDFRDLESASKEGNKLAQLAQDVFTYKVKKYIGSYAAAMNGLDAVVFTAGVGENSILIRSMCCSGLDALGISIDEEKNKVRGEETDISAAGARVKTFIIPTNEELMIALDTHTLAK